MGVSAGPVPALAAWSATTVGRAAGSASIPPFVELCWCTTPVSLRSRANMARTRQSSQAQILTFALMQILLNRMKLCPLRSEAVLLETSGLRLGVRAVLSRIPPWSTILALAKPGRDTTPVQEKFSVFPTPEIPPPSCDPHKPWRLANNLQCIPCSVSRLFGLTNVVVGPGSLPLQVDDFLPHAQHVMLEIVGEPE